MIVLDASAAIELLLNLPLSRRVEAELERADWHIHAPQLLVVEVLQVMRRRMSAGITSLAHADEARTLLTDLGIVFHDHELLAERIWMLRENLTAYDAAYVALAEALPAPLVTADARLAGAPGSGARFVLVDA